MGFFDLFMLWKKPKKKVRFLMLGLDNAGKTTCLSQCCDEKINNITPTQGWNLKTLTFDGFDINVWDLGGQKVLRKYWKDYYENNDAIIYVVDSADRERIIESGNELAELLMVDKLIGLPLIILANKQDLLNAMDPKELVETMQLYNIRYRNWHIQGSSATKNIGVRQGFEWVLQNIKK